MYQLNEILENLANPAHRFLPLNLGGRRLSSWPLTSFVEEEIVQCGKSAYVFENGRGLHELSYLKKQYPFINFQYLPQIGQATTYGIMMILDYDTKVYRMLEALVESGVYAKLRQFSLSVFPIERYAASREIDRTYFSFRRGGFDMNTNIQTIFIICAVILAVSTAAFAAELVYARDRILVI